MLTEEHGSSKLIRCPPKTPQSTTVHMQPFACVVENVAGAAGKQVADLLRRYQNILTDNSIARQKVTTGELKITLKDEKIINYHPYRLSFAEREKVRIIISDLLENGIIRESISPFASPIILVK